MCQSALAWTKGGTGSASAGSGGASWRLLSRWLARRWAEDLSAQRQCIAEPHEIGDALTQRERLGSTGIGAGIAIPHGKLAKAKGLFARHAATLT